MAHSAERSPGPDPHVLAQLEGLYLRARRIVEGYVSGMHKSPLRGFSQEFAEHREYVPGDDPRYVDWKIYGRTDKYYVKRFEEETNLVCYLLVDTSRSMDFQSDAATESKRHYAETAASALAYLILKQQDCVSLATYAGEIGTHVPPSGKPSHLKHLIEVMAEDSGGEDTRTGPIFHELAERFRKRGIIVVLSDLLDDPESILSGLRHFAYRRQEVVVGHILDPAELDFPLEGDHEFRGLEGEGRLRVDSRSVRKAYKRRIQRHLREIETGCRARGIDYLLMRTDQPVENVLSEYLTKRARFWG